MNSERQERHRDVSVGNVESAMRVTIDRPECISCGACWGECPDFFEENPDDHHSQVVAQFREEDNLGAGNAPPHLDRCVNRAAESCPVGIIHSEP